MKIRQHRIAAFLNNGEIMHLNVFSLEMSKRKKLENVGCPFFMRVSVWRALKTRAAPRPRNAEIL